jgi:hypothetical protein
MWYDYDCSGIVIDIEMHNFWQEAFNGALSLLPPKQQEEWRLW